MEQRPLRLGDLVDDYCPRERRITNHAIVAIVDEAIRQTRCMTCDAEHVFKGGKTPPRRSKRAGDQPEAPVDNTGGQLVPAPGTIEHITSEPSVTEEVVQVIAEAAPAAEVEEAPQEQKPDEIWPANRPLIRATLPRVEGELPPPRPIPEFTMHRYNARGASGFRQGRGWQDRGPGHGGNGAHGDRRQGSGNGAGGGHGRRRHGKKRPR